MFFTLDRVHSVYNNGGCTVDSGTTMMLLPDKAYDAMKQVFLANCSQSNLHGTATRPCGSFACVPY